MLSHGLGYCLHLRYFLSLGYRGDTPRRFRGRRCDRSAQLPVDSTAATAGGTELEDELNLREYQQTAFDNVVSAFDGGTSASLLVMATGCIAADSIIGINRGGKGYSRTIKKAFHAQFDKRVKPEVETMVRSHIDGYIGLNKAISIQRSGKKRTCKIDLVNGKTIRVTEDHEVLTENGYIPAGDLGFDHKVICEAGPIVVGKEKKKRYRQCGELRYHRFAGHASSLRKIGNYVRGRLYRVAYHRVVLEASLNNLDVSDFIWICKNDRERAESLSFLDPKVFAVHHINGDHLDNRLENLQQLTHSEHWRIEGKNKNFCNFGYNAVIGATVANVSSWREEETFDIVCDDPHRNFVANGIVVHNCGKTVVAAHIAKHYMGYGRIMVIAHRDELLKQANSTFKTVCGVMPVFEKAGEFSPENSLLGKPPIVISSVQTQNSGGDGGDGRRMERFNPDDFSLLWIDEAHRAPANSYIRIISYFRQNPNLKVLLVTATPDRADERGLKEVCDHVAFRYELPDAIKDGYLVPIRQRRVTIADLDFSKIGTTGDDFTQNELEAALLVEKPLHGIAHATIEASCGFEIGYLETIRDNDNRITVIADRLGETKPRPTILFAVSVSHAERLAEIINRWLPGSADAISGKSTDIDRARILRDFRLGRTRFLCNCMLVTEGFDAPFVEIVSMARPTKSRVLYSQCAGRATRPLEELAGLLGECTEAAERREIISRSVKPFCELLDFCGNSGAHKLVCSVDLLGVARPQNVLDRASEMIDESGMDVSEAIESAERDIKHDRELNQLLAEQEAERLDGQDWRETDAAARRRMNLVGTADYSVRNVSAFDESTGARQATNNLATPAQVKFLQGLGVNPQTAAAYSRRRAGAVIDSLKKTRCTERQRWALIHRLGMTEGAVEGVNFEQASDMLNARPR